MGEITNEQKRKTFLERERKNWNQIWRRKIRKKQSKCIFGSNNNDAFKHSHNQREERLESLAFSMLLHVAVKQSDCVDVNLFFSKKKMLEKFLCLFFVTAIERRKKLLASPFFFYVAFVDLRRRNSCSRMKTT